MSDILEQFDLDFSTDLDFGFTAVSSEEVEESKKHVEKLVDIGDKQVGLDVKLNTLEEKLNQVLAVAEKKYDDRLAEKESELEEINQKKFRDIEQFTLPLLYNLAKSSDEPYIHWPNRKEIVESQIKKIMEITRGEKL